MNTRRKIFVALGAGLLAAPWASFARPQNKIWRVGFLTQRPLDLIGTDHYVTPFRQGMRELGYVEGKNLVVEWRSAQGQAERLAKLADELVELKVDVIVTGGLRAALVAQKATATIPIVFGPLGNPVGSGLVKSLARPGGNITGLSNLAADIVPKQLEMLTGMAPRLARIAFLGNVNNNALSQKAIESAAQRAGVQILPVYASTVTEIEAAFSAMVRDKAGAVIVAREEFLNLQTGLIAQLAAKHKLPGIAGIREFTEAGGLMSYGSNLSELYRRSAYYVDKIFKGAKPGDLPVEQPTKFELVINGKTAKALGLTISYALRISAAEVIE